MKTHPYYTEIPQRSFDAIVKNDWISEILLALIIDPLSAEDVADSLERHEETRSLIIDPATNHAKPYPAPIAPSDFATMAKKAEVQFRITLWQWVMQFDQAGPAILTLTEYDRRLGSWCACQVAREALRFVPKWEALPLRAIETTEAWVAGMSTLMDVRKAAAAAANVSYTADAAHSNSARAAASAASAAYAAAANACLSAYYAASSAAAGEAELVRLREIVANACMTFPIMVSQ